ncbi:DUF2777 family protein [Shouchella shacheensis]|uniref:DUF2777 family protein n=1 Tax=Shouchella shacheensis TaxID=1649580 RepID=UPI00073FDCFE|nr:DUF2777 family protein [Shouchella shacheensis]
MNRNQAQQAIGQFLVIDLGANGRYLGELLDVIAEPKKPWRGKLRVHSVVSLPDSIFEGGTVSLHQLPYEDGDVALVPSHKLHRPPRHLPAESFIDSILTDLKRRHIRLKNDSSSNTVELEALEVYIKTLSSQKRRTRGSQQTPVTPFYIQYTFHIQDEQMYLSDEHGEKLQLAPSSFEYSWNVHDMLVSGHYEGDGVFVRANGQRYVPEEGATFYIDQKQFDPYFILRNELDPAALQGFEHNLKTFGLTHDDLIHCYNSLLEQLLYSESAHSFSGVNFLTYQTDEQFVLIQHHFKRELRQAHAPERVYDRFEFTTDKGKRTIALYTNALS